MVMSQPAVSVLAMALPLPEKGVTARLDGRRPLSTFAVLLSVVAITLSLGCSEANRVLHQQYSGALSSLSFNGQSISMRCFLLQSSYKS